MIYRRFVRILRQTFLTCEHSTSCHDVECFILQMILVRSIKRFHNYLKNEIRKVYNFMERLNQKYITFYLQNVNIKFSQGIYLLQILKKFKLDNLH